MRNDGTATRPTCGTADVVGEAEVKFLTDLVQGIQRRHPKAKGALAKQQQALRDKARQRARKSGRAEHGIAGWRITEAGRAYLATRSTPVPAAPSQDPTPRPIPAEEAGS